MDLIEYFHNQQPYIENFIPRKIDLPLEGNINLFGARGSGKTSILLDYLMEEESEEMLYIDFQDPHFMFHTLTNTSLTTYVTTNHIQTLILDHYDESTFHFLPDAPRIIILSRLPIDIDTFIGIELFPLDYEEFLAFENSNVSKSGFNHFLRLGTLPALARSQKNAQQTMQHFFQSRFDTQEQKLLILLAQHNTKHLTIHQIYTLAKEHFKLSKDWLYKIMKRFSEEKIVFFIEECYQKSGKKMILYDFSFAKYLTLGQPFIIQFETMIALTLMKHKITVQTLGIHGYLTSKGELIIPAPFETEESLWVKSQKKFTLYKKYHIKNITIVTVANRYQYNIEKIDFEALPFDEWSVLHNED